jgi:uncharacterized protein (TIGR02145 family)
MNPNFLPSGHLLHQRYSIQNSLGQGGFGITYLAYDSKLDQEVCIKELFVSGNSTRGTNLTVHSQTTGGFSFADFVQRFVQEARQLARFQHPNIVRVIDVFQENDTAYTVMEYVRGETLKNKVQRDGSINESTAMAIISQLLDAVEEVHIKGMLHRDIKPDNVIVTKEGRLVLIDFGSARDFSDGKTTTQTAMLTPGYAPPEQYSDRAKRGPFTDIYALGATMYYILTGEKPIPVTDRNLEELIPPHQLNANISSQVSSAVMLAMELKPEHRFQHISEMREALKSLKLDFQKMKTEEPVSRGQEEPKKNESVNGDGRKKIWVLFYGLVAIVIFGLIFYLSQDRTTTAMLTENTEESESIETENRSGSPILKSTENERENQGNLDQQAEADLQQERQAEQERQLKAKESGNLSDIQGNQYQTIRIGDQVWMAENLNVDRFRNGDRIPEAKTDEEWKRAGEKGEPAWSYYDNDPANSVRYGKLYNWFAVTDPRGLAPRGWHIPSDPEWTALTDYLGGEDAAGSRMKSTSGWKENGNGTNESGFSGLPGGFRNHDGEFYSIGGFGYWWSSTENYPNYAWYRFLYFTNGNVTRSFTRKAEEGFSVRCLRD